jgi:hypothetical protein
MELSLNNFHRIKSINQIVKPDTLFRWGTLTHRLLKIELDLDPHVETHYNKCLRLYTPNSNYMFHANGTIWDLTNSFNLSEGDLVLVVEDLIVKSDKHEATWNFLANNELTLEQINLVTQLLR